MYDDVYQYSLETILEHITVCNKRFTQITQPNDFISSEYGKILLDAVVTRLQAIGENIKSNSQKNNLLQKNYPDIEWNKIIRFRDFISHHYEMLDYEIVYEIGKSYLPQLELTIRAELDKFK
ncbi:HepT-like ribonuclease domain-containing protein [Flavobacterium aestuarii]|uniref:HepT-like ribonuclease domain-containing protein n=1 Tax=Flavobacterium aestuarii TaxID=3149227 RepID=UPI0032B416E4